MRSTGYALLVLAAAGLTALVLLGDAEAQSIFEKLVMPGELVAGHAKLEKNCGNCHEAFVKTSQSKLCLDCHKEVASDLARKEGFHGRHAGVGSAECSHCHDDHKGRQADIVGLDPQTFDHALTDFQLSGAHSALPCQRCHASGRKRRDAPSACIGCHKPDEPHKGRLGKRCDGCHGVDRWPTVKPFDHAKTQFPLVGAHREIACTTCHAGEQWKGIGRACVDCHRLEDAHHGRYGAKCESCHQPEKWKTVRFDHDGATKFPLKGAHRKVLCDACHTGDLFRDKLQAACISCHRERDVHKGRLGARCETCHNETSWRQKVTFDHDLSRFPLIGLHAAVACEACHTSKSFKDTALACNACHKDTHHEGRLGTSCERCHNPNGWLLWRFDHGKDTAFPLTGKHAEINCYACHGATNVATAALPTDCYSCHSGDDAHRGAFGRACGSCHSTSSFRDVLRRR